MEVGTPSIGDLIHPYNGAHFIHLDNGKALRDKDRDKWLILRMYHLSPFSPYLYALFIHL